MTTTLSLPHDVTQFLSRQPLSGFVGGAETRASNGECFVTRDPGTGNVLAEVYALQEDDVDRAVHAAADAFARGSWAKLPQNDAVHCSTDLPTRWNAGVTRSRVWSHSTAAKSIPRRTGTCRTSWTRPGTSRRWHCTSNAAALWQCLIMKPGRCGSRGDRAASSFPGTSRSCWSAGASRRPWPPATRW